MADPLDEIPTGIAPVVTDPSDNTLKELSGNGVLVVDNSGAKMRDGSTLNPLILQAISQLNTLSFPFIMIENSAGRVLLLPAQNDGTQRFLGSINGVWKAVPITLPTCFEYDDICDCEPDFIAGWMFNDAGQLCLVRLSLDDFGGNADNHFTNTNTTTITGTGTVGSPRGVNVKISAVAGNRIQILSDGLYVGPDY